jgi:hypothetical protein
LHLSTVRLRERDELREVVGGKILTPFEHHGLLGKERDRGEIVDRVVAPFFVDRLVVGMCANSARARR